MELILLNFLAKCEHIKIKITWINSVLSLKKKRNQRDYFIKSFVSLMSQAKLITGDLMNWLRILKNYKLQESKYLK